MHATGAAGGQGARGKGLAVALPDVGGVRLARHARVVQRAHVVLEQPLEPRHGAHPRGCASARLSPPSGVRREGARRGARARACAREWAMRPHVRACACFVPGGARAGGAVEVHLVREGVAHYAGVARELRHGARPGWERGSGANAAPRGGGRAGEQGTTRGGCVGARAAGIAEGGGVAREGSAVRERARVCAESILAAARAGSAPQRRS